MRVIHFHFGKDGGAERFFVNLANALAERGVEQKFIIRPQRIWRGEIQRCGEIIENHFRRFSVSQFWLMWRVRSLVRSFRPNAILSWMPRASRLMPAHSGPLKIARLGDFPNNLKYFGHCDVLVGNVPGIGQRCRDLGWQRRMEIISNFPRPVVAKPVARAELDTPADAFLVSSAGRFVPRKGMDILIRAVAKLDNAWLWLVGEGEEKEKLVALAAQVGLQDRVRFVGWQPEPAHYLAASDVFCLPSRHEPLGNVLLEAWSLGLPSVSARSEGPSWFMRDRENGMLVNIDDADGMAGALAELRSDRSLAERVVAGARETLRTQFSKEAITDQYLELFAGQPGRHPL